MKNIQVEGNVNVEKVNDIGSGRNIESEIKTIEDIRKTDIQYPVIIKPVDSSSSVGVTPCHNADELEAGYRKAVSCSKSGDFIFL